MSYQSLGIVTPIITINLESKLNPNTCYLSNYGEVPTLCRSQFSHLRSNNNFLIIIYVTCSSLNGNVWPIHLIVILIIFSRYYPWVRKIPLRRKWQATPVFLPGKFHWQRGPMVYSLKGCKSVGHNFVTKTTTYLNLNIFKLKHI